MRLHDTELSKFEGKDLWVKVLYQGFYTSNYEYIQVVALDDDDHMLFKCLPMGDVEYLASAANPYNDPNMIYPEVDIDTIEHRILGAPRNTLAYCYKVCHPIDTYTTEELLAAVEDLRTML